MPREQQRAAPLLATSSRAGPLGQSICSTGRNAAVAPWLLALSFMDDKEYRNVFLPRLLGHDDFEWCGSQRNNVTCCRGLIHVLLQWTVRELNRPQLFGGSCCYPHTGVTRETAEYG
ncbi:hypothetical protein BIW11_05015 [Tropilaelaps mercedesae]|uniref:Uncharacterized protein n=1 Tax=Tropilaelaps mercedesae TaxID=418985 RepID=A0A1V9WYH1_9ACAR|nr:hypothetical protein BIW11_05015 [Tropilaelaps mercedesae]